MSSQDARILYRRPRKNIERPLYAVLNPVDTVRSIYIGVDEELESTGNEYTAIKYG